MSVDPPQPRAADGGDGERVSEAFQLPVPRSSPGPRSALLGKASLVLRATERGAEAAMCLWNKSRGLAFRSGCSPAAGRGPRHPLNPIQWAEARGLEQGSSRLCFIFLVLGFLLWRPEFRYSVPLQDVSTLRLVKCVAPTSAPPFAPLHVCECYPRSACERFGPGLGLVLVWGCGGLVREGAGKQCSRCRLGRHAAGTAVEGHAGLLGTMEESR